MNMQLIENILEAAFDLKDFPAGSPVDPICERLCDAMGKASQLACDIATQRDRLAAYCTDLSLVSGTENENAKLALLAVFRPILVQLQAACDALGVK